MKTERKRKSAKGGVKAAVRRKNKTATKEPEAKAVASEEAGEVTPENRETVPVATSGEVAAVLEKTFADADMGTPEEDASGFVSDPEPSPEKCAALDKLRMSKGFCLVYGHGEECGAVGNDYGLLLRMALLILHSSPDTLRVFKDEIRRMERGGYSDIPKIEITGKL